ncbi:hypothetical protein ABW19_dt0204132 [Dactylella cylindrospora]|nr:hypothetical protein ABW19_dt0204132 [Dactylella cylindrospora]
MAESLADDHQQAGPSSAAAPSSANASTSSTSSHSKLPIPNGVTNPPQPQPQLNNGTPDPTLSEANLPSGSSPRDDATPSQPLIPLVNGQSSKSVVNSSKPADGEEVENNTQSTEDQGTSSKPTDESDGEEDPKEPRQSVSRQKPGPSSDITAAEWDGGMAKEDVQDNLDDLENADSESETSEERTQDNKAKVDKGKSPMHLVVKSSAPKSRATSPDKRKENGKSLRLIDLPLDVLKEIVREVTNTTDLCSLCLVHSSLHALAIPLIYSRFDIVWPDQTISSDRTGVDALTYGLATLVSNENDYAQYVRKFSLGNGPKEWVGEYAINKEGGKMLGTLVSLAVWKMGMLETFSWDMPTGILRDVWRALHRLKNLRNIHVRWHDNTLIEPVGSQDGLRKMEHPTFSGFKDLKSLSVLDLDELSYLREMATSVQKSCSSLRELRLGIAIHAQSKRWVHDDVETITPDSLDGIGEGGAIGIIVGKIYDFNKRASDPAAPATSQEATAEGALTQEQLAQILQGQQQQAQQQTTGDADNAASTSGASTTHTALATIATSAPPAKSAKLKKPNPSPSKQLRLENLELERVPISTRVIVKAIDFSCLVSLTLLNCNNQSKLFKALKRKYSPYPPTVLAKLSKLSLTPTGQMQNKTSLHIPPPTYRLRLKKIHTDMISNSLIEFLHHTLAPNSLETLFLQEAAGDHSTSSVDLSQIVTEVLRRHRLSVQRLLIDSYVQHPDLPAEPQLNLQTVHDRKKKWCFDKDTISFLTEMPRLREVAFGIDFENWHYLLTRLPEMRSLKSLYVPHVLGTVDFLKAEKQSDALIMMIVDVVTLRPECGLCYVGIVNKCFELLEGDEGSANGDHDSGSGDIGGGTDEEDDDDGSDEDDGTDDGNDEDASDDGNETEDMDDAASDAVGSPMANGNILSPFSPYGSGLEEDDTLPTPRKRPGIRYREILFYDDKVAVFKARHAKL